jgi:TolB protein
MQHLTTSARSRRARPILACLAAAGLLVGGARLLESGPAQAAVRSATNGVIVYQAFLAGTPGSQIFAVDPAGGAPVDLSGPNYNDDEPAVSPDGARIAFRHNGFIWVMNIDGSGRHQVGGAGSEADPSWSPDGTKLAFTTDARPDGFSYGGPNVWTMNADGTNRVQLTNNASSRQPAWSPDGSRIAYVVSANDGSDIYIMNADGSGPTDLTRTPNVDETEPDWSPDSARLAYTSTDLAGHGPGTVGPDLWTMNADGSNRTPLIHHHYAPNQISDGADPTWSPDGAQIGFVANNGTGGIHVWRVAATGGQDVQVSAEPGNPGDANPSWQAAPMTTGTSTTTAPSTTSTSTSTTVAHTTTTVTAAPACSQLVQTRANVNTQIDSQEAALRQHLTGSAQSTAIAAAEASRRQQNATIDAQLAQQGCPAP